MATAATPVRPSSWAVWAPAATWLAVGGLGWPTIAAALRETESAASWFVGALSAMCWLAVAVATLVPSPVSLTVVRWTAPLAPGAAGLALVADTEPAWGIAALAGAVVHVAVAASATTGRAFVQASAYGDEQRFPLRPPVLFVVPLVLLWSTWAGTALGSVALLADGRWWIGAGVLAIAVMVVVVVLPRAHRLSERWLVVVPAGLVVHDPVVLSETLMVTRANLRSIGLAIEGTEAADLTGPSSGHALEVGLADMVTALLPPTREHPNGRAMHVQSFLVAPSRPGLALTAATRR